MKCVILAAGYATRLYPLTEKFPKPLLDVNGKSILEWLLADINSIPIIDEVIIVSNHKFYGHFCDWRSRRSFDKTITILDDGSTENENRLGAVRDIAFAIKERTIADDLLVMAGDNLLDFSIGGFVDYAVQKNAACIMRHYEESVEKLQRTGVVLVDSDDKVLDMQEKPRVPKSNWAVPPFYVYTRADLEKIIDGVDRQECDTDAPGSFISWFCTKVPVYAYQMPGNRYDIGNMVSYVWIQDNYHGIVSVAE